MKIFKMTWYACVEFPAVVLRLAGIWILSKVFDTVSFITGILLRVCNRLNKIDKRGTFFVSRKLINLGKDSKNLLAKIEEVGNEVL